MTIKLVGSAINYYVGLSTDDRSDISAEAAVGSRLYEIDTGTERVFNGQDWTPRSGMEVATANIVAALEDIKAELQKHTQAFEEATEHGLEPIEP